MVNMAPISGADSYVTDSNGDRVGHKVRAKIGKNKVGSPFRKAEYTIEYLFGIVNQEEELHFRYLHSLYLRVLCFHQLSQPYIG